MDYLDQIEQERAAAAAAAASPPPLASRGLPTEQVSAHALQYAMPQAAAPVRAVGLAQRRIMWVILASFLLGLSFAFAPALPSPNVQAQLATALALVAARLAVIVLMMVGVYRLAAALDLGMTQRILYMLAMLIPFLGILVLLIVNQQATALLRRHGIKVGLMGARVADLPPA